MQPDFSSVPRRKFLRQSGLAAAGLAIYGGLRTKGAATSPNETMRVAVMGLNRGLDHVNALIGIKNVEVAMLCDIDDLRLARALKVMDERQARKPQSNKDIRKVLDDSSLDALFIAAPNHWHAPAAIMACNAGKHVYVEKPCSHNPWENEMIVAAARKHKRVVQMGNQRRSWPGEIEAMQMLRSGMIGKLKFARCWYNNSRPSIGRGKHVPVPSNLDYSLWQGPAPERPYVDNLIHYNWHWRWHWGNAELGNNGIHALDVARWGLGVDYPKTVTCNGGRYEFDDDQETPDTTIATYDFGSVGIMWDGSSCHPRTHEKLPFVTFYGDQGSMETDGGGYKIFDLKGFQTGGGKGDGGDRVHIENFLDSVRNGKTPNSEIAEGAKSTLLIHLGNIAYRTGRMLNVDASSGRLVDDKEGQAFWKRDYRKGWEPKV
ncbi:MAG: oxidoreductase domain protein [Verrucomicrobiales bacterium]|nr:oxidoreductase domain protein [Verrucomicrobiales bacterium]